MPNVAGAGKPGPDGKWIPAKELRRTEGHEPEQVMVPMFKCTVCEELFRYRSQLDHDGRCDECRP